VTADALEVGEQHLDALAVVARLLERLSSAQRTSDIASVFMDAAWDLREGSLGHHRVLNGHISQRNR
jgi:hypothetical protein